MRKAPPRSRRKWKGIITQCNISNRSRNTFLPGSQGHSQGRGIPERLWDPRRTVPGGEKKPLRGKALKLDTISSGSFVRIRFNWDFALKKKNETKINENTFNRISVTIASFCLTWGPEKNKLIWANIISATKFYSSTVWHSFLPLWFVQCNHKQHHFAKDSMQIWLFHYVCDIISC